MVLNFPAKEMVEDQRQWPSQLPEAVRVAMEGCGAPYCSPNKWTEAAGGMKWCAKLLDTLAEQKEYAIIRAAIFDQYEVSNERAVTVQVHNVCALLNFHVSNLPHTLLTES